jgi:3-oxoadipate enol-lactonase
MLLAYSDNGPGPVVVLLHGFPLSRVMWAEQTGSIGATYRVIAPDLRGHGGQRRADRRCDDWPPLQRGLS